MLRDLATEVFADDDDGEPNLARALRLTIRRVHGELRKKNSRLARGRS